MAKPLHEKLYANRQRPHELKEAAASQPSGFSTPKNVKEWSAYASRNSGPRIAPGLGKKTAPAEIRGPLPDDPAKAGGVDYSRIGWAADRGSK